MVLRKIRSLISNPLSVAGILLLCLFVLIIQSCSILTDKQPDPIERNSLLDSNFPAKMALAAYNKTSPDLSDNLEIDTALRCVLELDEGDFKNIVSADNSLLQSAIKVVGKNNDQVEITKAVQLIKTGKFYKDIIRAASTSIKLFPQLRNSINKELISPNIAICPISSISTGTKDIIKDPSSIIKDPQLLESMLSCAYKNKPVEAVAQTASTLLQNDSIKLAIIVYARANGINLNEGDLDALRNTVLNTESPDFDILVDRGIVRLKEKYNGDRVNVLLNEMDSKEFGC